MTAATGRFGPSPASANGKGANVTVEHRHDPHAGAPANGASGQWQAAALLGRAQQWHGAGRFDDAARDYLAVLANEPDHPQALHLYGVLQFQRGAADQAEALLRRSIALDASARALSDLGALVGEEGRVDEALDHFAAALRASPDDVQTLVRRGNTLLGLRRYDDALASFDRALALSPLVLDALCNRGGALRALGRFDEALDTYERALMVDPQSCESWFNRGLVLRELQRSVDALHCFERAHALRPGVAAIEAERGRALADLGRDNEALAAFNDAIAADPARLDVLRDSAAVLERLGRADEALARWERVLASDPDQVHALAGGGNALPPLRRDVDALDGRARSSNLERAPRASAPAAPRSADGSQHDGSASVGHQPDARRADAGRSNGSRPGASQPDDSAPIGNPPDASRADAGPSNARQPNPSAPEALAPDQLLARARAAHRDGALQQAEHAYTALLAADPDHPEALHLLGALRFQQGRLDDAEPLMRRSIERQPAVLALANYSAVLAGLGRTHDALARLDDALAINPTHARALFQRAGLLAELGRHDEGRIAYDRLLALTPGFADGYVKRSDMQRALGHHAAALADCDRAIALAGRTFDAMRARGLALRELGRYRDAADSYDHALALAPGSADVLFLRGVVHLDLHDPERALTDFNAAIATKPTFVDALVNSAIALEQLGRHDEALLRCDRALALEPRHACALATRGNAASQLGRHTDAIDSYARALDADPLSTVVLCNFADALMRVDRHADAHTLCERSLELDPQCAPAWFTRARVRLETHRYDDALDDLSRAIALAPLDKLAHFHRGHALRALRRHDDALHAYARVLDIDPDDAAAHCTRAFLCLSTGDFETGWAEYEWRWRDSQLDASRRDFAQPRWTRGMPLDGRTILLYPEQGLGDTLQFCRYVPLVKALGARVVLEAPVELTTLFATLDGVDVLVARGEPLPPFDLHCPLLSLPLEFRTNLASIPAGAPYLRADPERVERWRARLGDSGRARIGLVWTGNPLHLNDRNRSMTLAELLPLLDDRYDWISVQKVIRDDDRAVLDASAIRFVGDDLTDFAETAALIGALDAVISVDTSVAHLAGALGCPLAVLLPHTPDFRWLLDRDDSPWYPRATLFRQPAGGQWAPVVERVRAALPALLARATR